MGLRTKKTGDGFFDQLLGPTLGQQIADVVAGGPQGMTPVERPPWKRGPSGPVGLKKSPGFR